MARTHALVFPGQGSQRVGMLDRLPGLDSLDRLLDAAEGLSGLELATIASQGPDDALRDTRAAQPLLYLADWAWGATLLAAGLEPVALAGHSLGEYAALALAGVFSPEAGLELVIERSRLMAQAATEAPGAMAAVLGLDGSLVAESVAHLSGVWVANDNAPGQVIVSGTHAGLESAIAALHEAGARRIVTLDVAGAFHSPLMAEAAERFARTLEAAHFAPAAIPVVPNSDPTATTDPDVLKTRLAAQMVEPVRWTETMATLADLGAEVLVEAGPGSVLKGLARRVEGLDAYAVEDSGLELVVEVVL
ncbi:MAG: ACP S-malonyltransferase [Anaerosomatales bacterium]|nr:ACP S-malonyltransferase [Anaerosomatales bacterium]